MSRRALSWTAAALLGIVASATVAWSASMLAGQRIGLASEPLAVATRHLAPAESGLGKKRHAAQPERTGTHPLRHRPRPTTSTHTTVGASAPTVTIPPPPSAASPASRSGSGSGPASPGSAAATATTASAAPAARSSGSGSGDDSGGGSGRSPGQPGNQGDD